MAKKEDSLLSINTKIVYNAIIPLLIYVEYFPTDVDFFNAK